MTRTATRTVLPLTVLTTTLALVLPAQAQLTRTFVSAAGSDGNPCTITQPCATFAHAYSVTAASGIIAALDPGKYGPLTINGAITINGNGWAAITAPAKGNGITISAGTSDKVALIGLEIDGAGAANYGIQFIDGASLTVEDCVIRNMVISGIELVPGQPAVTQLAVSNSYFSDNGDGILIDGGSSTVTASVDRTGFYGNQFGGLVVDAPNMGSAVSVAATDSIAANNGVGFWLTSGGSVANLQLTRVQITGNTTGVRAIGTNATLWLAQSTIMGNAAGFDAESSGVINSYGDNYLSAANGANTGTLGSANKL